MATASIFTATRQALYNKRLPPSRRSAVPLAHCARSARLKRRPLARDNAEG